MERDNISGYFTKRMCLNKNKMQFISKGAYPTTQYKSTQHCSYSDVLPPYLYYTSFFLPASIQSVQFRYEPAVFMPYYFHCTVL